MGEIAGRREKLEVRGEGEMRGREGEGGGEVRVKEVQVMQVMTGVQCGDRRE